MDAELKQLAEVGLGDSGEVLHMRQMVAFRRIYTGLPDHRAA